MTVGCPFAYVYEGRKPSMTYSDYDLKRIADAIGCNVAQVKKHRPQFEAAAKWYHLDKRAPRRTAPSHLKRELQKVEGQARRLLKSLGPPWGVMEYMVCRRPSS